MTIATEIVLTPSEIMQASFAGLMRQVRAISKGWSPDRDGVGRQSMWHRHIEGALAEFAVRKALNVCSLLDNDGFGSADVGSIQVRATQYKTGHLIIHEREHDDHYFVLAIGEYGRYVLRGWITGREGKCKEWWRALDGDRAGGEAFNVPQGALRSMDQLPAAARV